MVRHSCCNIQVYNIGGGRKYQVEYIVILGRSSDKLFKANIIN